MAKTENRRPVMDGNFVRKRELNDTLGIFALCTVYVVHMTWILNMAKKIISFGCAFNELYRIDVIQSPHLTYT